MVLGQGMSKYGMSWHKPQGPALGVRDSGTLKFGFEVYLWNLLSVVFFLSHSLFIEVFPQKYSVNVGCYMRRKTQNYPWSNRFLY